MALFAAFLMVVMLLTKPVGRYIANVMEGRPIWPLRAGAKIESLIYLIVRRREADFRIKTTRRAGHEVRGGAGARVAHTPAVHNLIEAHSQGRVLGFLGEPRVNVLEVNLALDALTTPKPQ